MNRKYPIQVMSSTSFLPVLPDGSQYFIVGAINRSAAATIRSIKKNTIVPDTVMACPAQVPITVPGLGIPVSQFKLDSAAEVQVYYYTT